MTRSVLATLLQLAGLAVVVYAAFRWDELAGIAAAGVAAFIVGLALERGA